MRLAEFTPPLIIAHRGYRSKYPENTLAAFQAALDIGAKMIELDVTLSQDRKVVVIHDDTLERTTSGKGAVNDCTLAQLKQLDAGACFSPEFVGECIPTLSEVLDWMQHRILVNIEIKPSCYEPDCPADAIENQVAKLVHQKNAADYVLISTSEKRFLERMAKMSQPLPLALISRNESTQEIILFCKQFKIFSCHLNYRKINQEQIRHLHNAGIRVFPYTVNSAETLRELLEMGADGVFTDDPLGVGEIVKWLSG